MDLKSVERISKAIGDPHRIKILQAVKKQGCLPCADICNMIDLTQSSISHHVKQLTDAGLLIAEKEGRNVRYTLDKKLLNEYTRFLATFA
ncbi:metalloregulator ArsR/SmtB family transcription factor [uncultured Chitinophaga sp.]|uniref:ArsR/SmtB family transcription factor n=1 Tax=uncultured Chitinophaga sp. TaxID=339340 RepID=UPI0026369B0B|nr:metalloregulator ArsR/SmtB family transcription factor [uncultured Chitinophaga sp.]